jgi:hypothetical protein
MNQTISDFRSFSPFSPVLFGQMNGEALTDGWDLGGFVVDMY